MTVSEIKTVEPNPELINRLKLLLEDAESGKIQGIVGIVIYESAYSSDFWVSAPKDYHLSIVSDRIIGCIERIKYQLLSSRHNVDAEDNWTIDP